MPETAGNASDGEHLEDSAPRPETGTHGADSGEEAKDAINERDGPSLLDMDAQTRRRWGEALLQLPDVDGEALDPAPRLEAVEPPLGFLRGRFCTYFVGRR